MSNRGINKHTLQVPTSEKAREIGRKGGLASGEAKRKRKEEEEQIKKLRGVGLLQELLYSSAPDKIQKKIKDEFEDTLPEAVKITNEFAMLIKQIQKAMKEGDVKATQFVFERCYGKAIDKQELTGKDGKAIEIKQEIDIQSIKALKDQLEQD